MDPSLRSLILQTWWLIRRTGADYGNCVEWTADLIERVRPQMKRDDAVAAIRFVLRKRSG